MNSTEILNYLQIKVKNITKHLKLVGNKICWLIETEKCNKQLSLPSIYFLDTLRVSAWFKLMLNIFLSLHQFSWYFKSIKSSRTLENSFFQRGWGIRNFASGLVYVRFLFSILALSQIFKGAHQCFFRISEMYTFPMSVEKFHL